MPRTSRSPRRSSDPSILGAAIGTTFRVSLRNLPLFFAIVVIVQLPWILLVVAEPAYAGVGDRLRPEDMSLDEGGRAVAEALGVGLLQMVLWAVCSGAICYGVVETLRSGSVPAGQCLSHGLAVVGRVVATSVLIWLRILVPFVVAAVPAVALAMVAEPLIELLMLVAAVFATRTALRLFVAVPVTVVERASVRQSFARSIELTTGSLGQVFAVLFLLGLFAVVVSTVAGAFGRGTTAQLYVIIVANLVGGVVWASLSPVLYVLLRKRREGLDLATLEATF
jgi:hypothetical protein